MPEQETEPNPNPPEQQPAETPSVWVKSVLTAILAALLVLAWSGKLDSAADLAATDKFKSALAIAALARTFNGVISVAQGTEVAVQPIGIGVTLTVGELLDPLNDLVERFSLLALVASVSLGLQITLGQILATTWLSGILTGAVVVYVALLWWWPNGRSVQAVMRIVATLIFARFLVASAVLLTHWIDTAFLAERQTQAVEQITKTTENIENLQRDQRADTLGQEESSLLEGIDNFLQSSRQTLDIEAQLRDLVARIETSVEEMINLIVVFALQTVLLPLLGAALVWWGMQAFWRWLGGPSVR